MWNAQSTPIVELRWKGLYQLGGWAAIASEVVLILGIVTFFIWPYAPGVSSVADVFVTLQTDRLAGLISLDLAVPVMLPILVLQMLALALVGESGLFHLRWPVAKAVSSFVLRGIYLAGAQNDG
jgi:hypothetical protein